MKSKTIAASAGMLLVAFAGAGRGEAQSIENGVGVICDLPAQVEEFIRLGIDSQSAIAQINAQSNARVCEMLNIAFLVGAIVTEASNDKGRWQIRKILVVGLYVGPSMSPVQPYQKYTAFLTSKAAPI